MSIERVLSIDHIPEKRLSLIQSFINKSIVAWFLDHLNSTYIEIFHFKQICRCCNTMNSREFLQSTFTYFGIRSTKNAQALGSFCGYRGTDYVKQKNLAIQKNQWSPKEKSTVCFLWFFCDIQRYLLPKPLIIPILSTKSYLW